MTTSVRCLDDFRGRWNLTRDIVHADGTRARFLGSAQWDDAPLGLNCRESGTLTLAGGIQLKASRTYLWHPDLSVRFSDDRPFHKVPPAGGKVRHACDPDTYEGSYDFGNWPDFSVTWRVSGPHKDYRMQTWYRRI